MKDGRYALKKSGIVNDKRICTVTHDSIGTCSCYMVIKLMEDSIKILSDMTKKDVERCLVLGWFVPTDHLK